MNDNNKTLLDVRHLAVGFESYNARLERVTFQAISDLSVSVSEGEILAIVGSSGSGKSWNQTRQYLISSRLSMAWAIGL